MPIPELLVLLLHVDVAQIFIVVHIDCHPARIDPLLLPHSGGNRRRNTIERVLLGEGTSAREEVVHRIYVYLPLVSALVAARARIFRCHQPCTVRLLHVRIEQTISGLDGAVFATSAALILSESRRLRHDGRSGAAFAGLERLEATVKFVVVKVIGWLGTDQDVSSLCASAYSVPC